MIKLPFTNKISFGFVLFCCLHLQACMLTGKMDKIVTKHYSQKKALRPFDNKNNFLIHTDSLPVMNGFCRSHYKSFFTVPLMIYFYSDEKIKCSVNPRFYVNAMVDEINILAAADSAGPVLKDRFLEIFFTAVPNSFHHRYNNQSVFIPLFFIPVSLSFTKNELYYPQGNLRLNYVLRDTNYTVLKRGSLEELVPNYYWRRDGGVSSRKFYVEDFVSYYDNEMILHCRQMAQKLIASIK